MIKENLGQALTHRFLAIIKFLDKQAFLLLWLAIILYITVFSSLLIIKYNYFHYDALDLAIFNQVFYNTSQGQLFEFTIHPHSYLGDHLGLIILLVTPLYLIAKNPQVLLIIQTVFIGLAALPLFLIAKRLLKPSIALLISLMFLGNPFIQNLNAFEFHLLPLVLFFLFCCFFFYQTKRFNLFLLFLIFSLLVREDIALFTIVFSLLAALDKRPLKWILWPLAISSGWFIIAFKLFPYFNDYGSYKFLYYYSWMGASVPEMISHLATHPLETLSHIFSVYHLSLIIALFSVFIFIPLLRLRYLLFTLLPLLQIFLANFAGGELVLKTHYSTLILAGVFIGLTCSLSFALDKKEIKSFSFQKKAKMLIQSNRPFIFTTLVAVTIYAAVTFGPLPALASMVFSSSSDDLTNLKQHYVSQVSSQAKVAASYEFLAPLSSRPYVYSLHYAFLGQKQYSKETYELPEIDTLLIDFQDFIVYQVQFPESELYGNAKVSGGERIRSLINDRGFTVSQITDRFALLKRNENSDVPLYFSSQSKPDIKNVINKKITDQITMAGWNPLSQNQDAHPQTEEGWKTVPISIVMSATKKVEENYQLQLEAGEYKKIFPLAYGLYPTSEWKRNEWVTSNYWLLFPEEALQDSQNLMITLVKPSAEKTPYLGLDGQCSVELNNLIWEEIGEKASIPLQSLTW